MSLEQLHLFIEYLHSQAEPQLKQSLQLASAQQNLAAFAALAQQAGFAVDVNDLHEFHAQEVANLNDENLSQSTGGAEVFVVDEFQVHAHRLSSEEKN